MLYLKKIYISDNKITDIKTICSKSAPLAELSIANNRLTSLAGIQHCQALTLLDVSGNPLTSVTPLLKLKKIQTLVASNTGIKDKSALSGIASLRHIVLGETE